MKTKVASRSRSGHHHSKHTTTTNKRSQKRRDYTSSCGRKYNGRKESSTSIESQIIALKKTTYPNVSHKVGLFTESTKKHNCSNGLSKALKRRSANVGLQSSDLNDFLMKNGQLILPFLQNQDMLSSSDEEAYQPQQKIQDQINMVLGQNFNGHNSKTKCEPEIIEVTDSHEKSVQAQAALENLFKNVKKSNESMNRNSRNSTRSRQSRKSQAGMFSSNRRPQRKVKRLKSAAAQSPLSSSEVINISDLKFHFAMEANQDADSKSSSSDEMDIAMGVVVHSSYSGTSSGKPHSRNSKTSCDVGIQADAHEIATQTLTSPSEDNLKLAARHLNGRSYHKQNYDLVDATEMHSLLNNKYHREAIIMSEPDKLKMLLLPSK